MKKLITILTVSIFCAANVYSFTDSHKKTTLQLLDVTNSKAYSDQMMASMRSMLDERLNSLNIPTRGPSKSSLYIKEVYSWIDEAYSWEKLKEIYASVYIEAYTEDEMKELIDFYHSPLGRKILEKTPFIISQTMTKMQEYQKQNLPEFKKRLDDTIKKIESN